MATEEELIAEVKKFVRESEGADSRERSRMLEDLRFVYEVDHQWSQTERLKRGNRPSYTFNRVIGAVNQVIGDQRQSSPQIKVRGVDGESDPEVAEINEGLIRNIEDQSDAQTAYDMAFKQAVAGGWGAWRVLPEFKSDRSFEQEIFIKPVYNPFTVFWDPLAQDPRKRDQNKCVIAERISREQHEALFGKEAAEKADNIEVSRDGRGWFTTDQVRIAEYFKREPVDKEIALLTDGRVVELTDESRVALDEAKRAAQNGVDVPVIARDEGGNEKIRKARSSQITWWKVDGAQILEGPITYDWQFIPVVKMCGRFINIEGQHLSQSLIRHSKDAQRVYNYDRTTMSEVVANSPRAVWLATDEMLTGHEKEWAEANAKNSPVLRYKVDQNASTGAPTRIPGPDVPAALVQMANMDSDDVKATTGFFDASLGERGPQESGEAIRARQQEGDTGSFEFMDNLAKALEFTGEILIDMIPKVYDTERTVRILGLDGQEDFVKINAYDESRERKFDLGAGRYNVSVSVGPAFATQRRESLRTLLDAAKVMPLLAELGPDLIVKNLDVQGADDLEKRMRKQLIAQGVIEPNEDEQDLVEEPQPDPVQLALVEESQSKSQANQARAAKDAQAAQEAAQLVPLKTLQDMEDLVEQKLKNQKLEEEIRLLRKEQDATVIL
jgi:hypothetical protein